MVDDVDRSVEIDILEQQGAIKVALDEAAKMPEGNPGNCLECLEPSKRLVKGVCAPCRDELGLP